MNELLLYWFLFVAFSAFVGTILAWTVLGIAKKISNWIRSL